MSINYLGFNTDGFKGGRVRPSNPPRLHFHNYITQGLPSPPPSVDYSAAATESIKNVYLNDQLGDCCIAGGGHIVGVWTGNAGDLLLLSDNEIKSDYTSACGPGDQGCNESMLLDWWVRNGFFGGKAKLLGYLGVDATNKTLLQQALYLFENLYFGVELPDEWVNPMPQSSGFTWDVAGDPNPGYGHCIAGCGYDDRGVKIMTWGMTGTCTYPALAKYMVNNAGGEAYVLVSDSMLIKAQNKAGNGIDWYTLIQDFNSLGGNIPLPPVPTPVVPPAPPFNPDEPPPFAPMDLVNFRSKSWIH